MGKATVNRTGSINQPANRTTIISDLRAAIQAGNTVDAADVNKLITFINDWDNHTHSYTDRYQQATFGNNGDRTLYQRDITSAKHDQDNTNVAAVAVGDVITAAKHNEMRGVCNDLRSHNHQVNDRTSK